ncbi:MAG: class I SAM-dependent methyltransferase [Acidobacteriota bacterium]|nr:class I SAM-dependent methyltransferase [Acidobacteriota bacterium]
MSNGTVESRSVNPDDWGEAQPGPLNGRIGLELAELLVTLVRQQPDVRSICDLGCGNGYLAGRLGALGHRVVGLDASVPYLEAARQYYASDNVTFRRAVFGADADLAHEDEAAFDLVISSDVIEHLYRPADLIETAARLLRPGGRLIVGTPYHGYWKNLAISVLGKWDEHHGVHWQGGHIKFFSVETLSQLVGNAGFSDIRFHFYGRAPWFWKNMICVARKVE